ncbi:MAG TPA: phosphodiesterase [Candidatus Sulfotelmatobacter sp.]|nr:phosphodiesterase [Candidatus Sulfotelmatobacter sp.]
MMASPMGCHLAAGMQKFIHITDPHFVPPGNLLYGLNPIDRLALCIADVNKHHGDAAFAIVTGDLAHMGQFEAYEALKRELDKLSMPYHLLVGNHDDRANFRAVFPGAAADANGFVQFTFEMGEGVLGICLDTNEPGKPWGSFCATRAAWLRQTLDETGERPVIVFMHHPPFKVRLKRMDDISLLEPGHFVEAVAGRHNIRHLFFGHLHRPVAGSWRGIPVSTLRATSHQVALDFVIEGRIMGSHEPPAYGVVLLEPDQMIVHMHDFLDRTNTFLL